MDDKNEEKRIDKDDEIIKEILKPSGTNKKQNSDKVAGANNKILQNSGSTTSTSSTDTSDSRITWYSDEQSTSESAVTAGSEITDAEIEYIKAFEREDPKLLPKGVKYGYNFMGDITHKYSHKVPASKIMRDIQMRESLVDDTKLSNYEQTSVERENLEAQGIDYVLNQFGEVIRLDQISEAELKTIISKKALVNDLTAQTKRPNPTKFNIRKNSVTKKATNTVKDNGFLLWLEDQDKYRERLAKEQNTVRGRMATKKTKNPVEVQIANRNHNRNLKNTINMVTKERTKGFDNNAYDRKLILSSVNEREKVMANYMKMKIKEIVDEYNEKWKDVKEMLIGPEPLSHPPLISHDGYDNPEWIRWFVRKKELERKWELERPYTEAWMDWELEDRSDPSRFAYCRTEFWNHNYGNMPLDVEGKIVLDEQDQIVPADSPEVRADLIRFLEKRGIAKDKDFIENSMENNRYWRNMLLLWRDLKQVSVTVF